MKKRNNNIDIIKGIASLSVVFIHFSMPGIVGKYLVAISRYAVPFFFFVSGYFLLNNNNIISSQRLFYKIKHTLKLLFYSGIYHYIFFVLYNIYIFDFNYNIGNFFIKRITKEKLLKFIITNDPFIYSHLWHLLALLYIYIFVYLINLKNKNLLQDDKFLAFIIYFGILGYLILGEFYGLKLIKTTIPLKKSNNFIYIRNIFFFRALPHFILGVLFKLKKFELKIKSIYLFFLFLFGSLISCLEMYYLSNKCFITYIGTFIQLISLIIISISDNIIIPKGTFFLYIGTNLSDKIYIYHISIGKIVDLFAIRLNINNINLFKFCKFFTVYIITLLFTFFIGKIKKIIN